MRCEGREARSVLAADEDELARLFWERSAYPIRDALLGSAVCREMLSSLSHGANDVAARSRRLEGWAIGVLDACEDGAVARVVLSHRYRENDATSSVRVPRIASGSGSGGRETRGGAGGPVLREPQLREPLAAGRGDFSLISDLSDAGGRVGWQLVALLLDAAP